MGPRSHPALSGAWSPLSVKDESVNPVDPGEPPAMEKGSHPTPSASTSCGRQSPGPGCSPNLAHWALGRTGDGHPGQRLSSGKVCDVSGGQRL